MFCGVLFLLLLTDKLLCLLAFLFADGLKLGSRHALFVASGGIHEALLVIGIDGAGEPAARGGDVEVTGINGGSGKGINGDDDPVNRFALCVLASDGVAV